MIRHYKFAGIEISVDIPDEKMYQGEHRLGNFAAVSVENPHVFKFELKDSLDTPAGECLWINPTDCLYQDGNRRIRYVGSVLQTLEGAYIRVNSEKRMHQVQLLADTFPDRIGPKTVLNSLDITHLVAQQHGFILHCSYIERNGKAILFTAPSGTGKSTQAELWREFRGAEIINGDRAVVRIIRDKIFSEGIPFAGSSIYCKNRSLPIEAIVYLGQAPHTTIYKLQGYKAFSRLWEGVSVNLHEKKDAELISEAVQKTAAEIPMFYLSCTPDESAVIALEEALGKKG